MKLTVRKDHHEYVLVIKDSSGRFGYRLLNGGNLISLGDKKEVYVTDIKPGKALRLRDVRHTEHGSLQTKTRVLSGYIITDRSRKL